MSLNERARDFMLKHAIHTVCFESQQNQENCELLPDFVAEFVAIRREAEAPLLEKIAFLEGELKAVETKAGIENVFEQGKAMGFAEGESKGRAEGLKEIARLEDALRDMQLHWIRFYNDLPDGEYAGLGEMRQASIHAGKALIGEDYGQPDSANMGQALAATQPEQKGEGDAQAHSAKTE